MSNYLLIADSKATAAFAPLAGYESSSLFGVPTVSYAYFWQRYLYDDNGPFTFRIKLSRPAVGGESVSLSLEGGNAANGTDFSAGTATLVAGPGDVSLFYTITPVDKGKWFSEKDLIIRLSSTDFNIHPKQDRIRLVIVPATDPPLIDIVTDSDTVTSASDTVTFNFELSYDPYEPVEIHYLLSGDLVGHLSLPASGSVTINPGSTSGSIVGTYDGAAAVSDSLEMVAHYEKDGVRYVEQYFDCDAGLFQVPRDIRTNENLWRYSNDFLTVGLEFTPSQELPWFGGYPTTVGAGGVGTADPSQNVLDILDQEDASPKLDPVTGNPLKYTSPNSAATGWGYLRQSFNNTFSGGPRTLHELREWCRVRYSKAAFGGADAGKEWEFHRIGMRVRTQDRNHGVIFRSDVNGADAGLDKNGNIVPIYGPFSDGLRYWFWSKQNCHPTDLEYGVYDDPVLGTTFYFVHHVDSSVVYATGLDIITGLPSTTETAGVDDGNPIEYPAVWDSANNTDVETLDYVKANNLGVLAHSFSFEMSDTPLSGRGEFWPCVSNSWAPRGKAIKAEASTNSHTVTVV